MITQWCLGSLGSEAAQNAAFCSKTAVNLHSGLLTAKTACRRASWRPRQPLDGSSGAQDGLRTGLLALKMASGRAS